MKLLSLSVVLDQDSFERKTVVPRLNSFLIAGILALPFGVALQAGFVGMLLLSLFVAALGYVCRNSSLAFILLGSVFAAIVAVLFVLGRLWPRYVIDARLAILFCILLVIPAARVCRMRMRFGELGLPAAIGSAFVMSVMVWPARRMNDAETLAFIAGVERFAEDNGAWMQALAKMSDGSSTRLNIDGTYGAGHGTELMLAVTREFNHLISPWFDGTWASNARVLVSSYSLVSLGVVLLSLILARQLFGPTGRWRDVSLVPLAVLMFALTSGISEVGHYSALVAVGFILLALIPGAIDHQDRPRSKPSLESLTLPALLAASQAWIALFPVFAILLLIVVVRFAAVRIQVSGRPSLVRLLIGGVFGVLVVLTLWNRLFAGYGSLFAWESVNRLIRLGGGVQSIRAELYIAFVVLTVGLCVKEQRLRRAKLMNQVITSTLGLQLLILVIALSIAPYTLSYGPLKLMYMTSMILAPTAFVFVISSVVERAGVGLAVLAGVVAFSIVGLLSPPGAEWTWMYKSPPADWWPWAPAVASALKTTDPVSVGCLTVDESGRPQEDSSNYLCARYSFGLTGTVKRREHNLWMWAHSCDRNREIYRNSWTDDFLASLIVLVQIKDIGKPCGSSESSPVNPFEFLDWSKVNLIDLSGERTVIPG